MTGRRERRDAAAPTPAPAPEVGAPTPRRSVEDAEGSWPTPEPDATSMMRRVYAARRLPAGELDVEQLRLLLGQHEGAELLVPVVLPRLAVDPLLEGDHYPGDVLAAVLRLPTDHWLRHPDQATALRDVLDRLDPGDADYPTATDLTHLVAAFLAR